LSRCCGESVNLMVEFSIREKTRRSEADNIKPIMREEKEMKTTLRFQSMLSSEKAESELGSRASAAKGDTSKEEEWKIIK
jgi:hypothetical protein